MTYFVIGLCLGMIVMAVIGDRAHKAEITELRRQIEQDGKNYYNAVNNLEKMLRDERIAWQAEHPKPWYLVKQS